MMRKRITLQLNEDQKQELEIFRQNAPSERIGLRAAMVLDCALGMKVIDVAAKYTERPNTVVLWKRRYAEHGINGLLNLPRGKSKDGYGSDFTERLLSAVHSPPPGNEQRWSIALLAKHLAVPEYGIRRHLKKAGIDLEEDNQAWRHLNDCSETSAIQPEASADTHKETDKESSVISEERGKKFEETRNTAGLHVELAAKIEDDDGNLIMRKVADAGSIPDLNHFDVTSVSGFRRDHGALEQGMARAFGILLEEISDALLSNASARQSEIAKSNRTTIIK